ncbi:hypothetical protein KAU32_02645 [bacterium]|nr:hypothetical protein [bacterium]
MTFLELALKVLKETGVPMNTKEIWKYAESKKYSKHVDSKGKTPWYSIQAQIYVNIRDKEDSPFLLSEFKPRKFLLKSSISADEVNPKEKKVQKKYQGKLVIEYVENLSSELLSSNSKIILDFIKGKQGIYSLYKGDKLYYVGLASYMHQRLKQHLNDRHKDEWNKFNIYLTENTDYLKEMESLVLRISTPKGNKQKGKFVAANNLKRKLIQRFREESQKKEKQLFGKKDLNKKSKSCQPIEVNSKRTVNELSKYISKPINIRLSYKGNTYYACILKNGSIKYNDTIYNSPSRAALAIVKQKTINGWTKWKYKNDAGEWVYINKLRSKK